MAKAFLEREYEELVARKNATKPAAAASEDVTMTDAGEKMETQPKEEKEEVLMEEIEPNDATNATTGAEDVKKEDAEVKPSSTAEPPPNLQTQRNAFDAILENPDGGEPNEELDLPPGNTANLQLSDSNRDAANPQGQGKAETNQKQTGESNGTENMQTTAGSSFDDLFMENDEDFGGGGERSGDGTDTGNRRDSANESFGDSWFT